MYGGACTGVFTQSLLYTVAHLNSQGYQVSFITLFNESLITRARNILTEVFLRSGSDSLLFIDADQSFRGVDIDKMYQEEKDILGAVVPMKGINWEGVRLAVKNGKEDLTTSTGIFNFNPINEEMPDLTKAFEVATVGTGMMLVKRQAFLDLQHKVEKYRHNSSEVYGIKTNDLIHNFWDTKIDEDGILLSEDYNFCKMWRDNGNKVYAVAYPEITHVGSYQFSGSLLK